MTRSELIRAAQILAAHCDSEEAEVVQRLIAQGFEPGPAHRIVAFVPSAFARPLLEDLGVPDFVDRVSVPTRDGGDFDILLSHQPEYVAALDLAREHRKSGVMPHEVYKTGRYEAESEATQGCRRRPEMLMVLARFRGPLLAKVKVASLLAHS
jgi:hypothetical protein